jgi:hypothetical protein
VIPSVGSGTASLQTITAMEPPSQRFLARDCPFETAIIHDKSVIISATVDGFSALPVGFWFISPKDEEWHAVLANWMVGSDHLINDNSTDDFAPMKTDRNRANCLNRGISAQVEDEFNSQVSGIPPFRGSKPFSALLLLRSGLFCSFSSLFPSLS